MKHPKTTAVLGKAGHRNGGSVSSGPGLVAGPRAWLTGQSSVCPPACEPLSFGTITAAGAVCMLSACSQPFFFFLIWDIVYSMDMSLRRLQETVKDRGAWQTTVHRVPKSQT